MTAAGKRSKTGRRLAIYGGGILAFILFIYLFVRLAAPGIVTVVLERTLKVPVHIGHLEFSPFAETIRLTEFRLGQPEGYGQEPMLSVEEVEIAGWRGIFSADRHLGEIRINELHLDITTNSDDQTNLSDWIGSIVGDPKETPEPEETEDPLIMMIDRITVAPIHIVRRDLSVSIGGYELTIENGELDIQNLVIGPYPEAPDGSVRFHCEFFQPETENAKIMVASQFGPIATDEPMLRCSARLTGCLFQTFVPVIPSTTGLILGGEGLDLDLDLAVLGGRIHATGAARTSNGSSYPFQIRGSTEEPVFELPETLASVATRMSGGMGRLMSSSLHSGKEILVGALDTAASLGKGALNATGSFLKGAGRTAAGWATGDKETSDTGLQEMTSETGGQLLGAFSESADAVSEAGDRTTQALTADPRFQDWVNQIPARHEERAATALEDLFQSPFPPVIPDSPEDAG